MIELFVMWVTTASLERAFSMGKQLAPPHKSRLKRRQQQVFYLSRHILSSVACDFERRGILSMYTNCTMDIVGF